MPAVHPPADRTASPEILVCLGALSAQTLLGIRAGITRARGSWFNYECSDGRAIPAIAMLHPAYLLRQPAQKRAAWADMRALAAALAKTAPDKTAPGKETVTPSEGASDG